LRSPKSRDEQVEQVIPMSKAEIRDLQNQERLEDQHIPETKLDISLNEDSRSVLPSSWNSSRQENHWIGQIDRR
jgi:hypothetical protein